MRGSIRRRDIARSWNCAKQITTIWKLNDLTHGLSANPGVIRGGTRTNVIAAEATAEIDVRIAKAKQAGVIDRKFRALKPFDKRCSLSIQGGVNRMPMERNAGVAALYEKARAIAKQIGWNLEEAAVGGGSDGNFTAGMGIPTLDGMGGDRPGSACDARTHRDRRITAARTVSGGNDRERLKDAQRF